MDEGEEDDKGNERQKRKLNKGMLRRKRGEMRKTRRKDGWIAERIDDRRGGRV